MCDTGYEGYDCSLKSCPLGDDPTTKTIPVRASWAVVDVRVTFAQPACVVDQQSEVQTFSCKETTPNQVAKTFKLKFRQMTTAPISKAATPTTLKAALEALATVGTSVEAHRALAVCADPVDRQSHGDVLSSWS